MFALSTRGFLITAILLGLVGLLLGGSNATASNGCRKVNGRVTIQPVDPGKCSSPIGHCGQGLVMGDIQGKVFVASTSVVPTIDTATTGVTVLTADSVFTLADGTLTSKDASTFSATGEYVEVITIIGGTGRYAGATGTLFATGATTVSGAQGVYNGQLCLP
jgi:hypothetical protein